MNTFIVPATKLKAKVSDVLDDVYFRREIAIVERYGKRIAKIVPYEEREAVKKKEDARAFWKKFYGIFPDFPDVTKDRYSRDRSHIKL
jgi:prevent-host-death family protein